MTPAFSRYIGIGYSGAETPNASLKGLRVYLARGDSPAAEVPPPPSPRKYWTRRGIGEWLAERLAEERCKAKSVFHFDVQGSVAKSTHAGIPWLRYLRKQLGARVHFWPFDGWDISAGRSALAEVYPALWKHAYAPGDRTSDQHDAYTVATWLREADRDGRLLAALKPALSPPQRAVGQVEGWILGVG